MTRRSLLLASLLLLIPTITLASSFEGTKWKIKLTPDEDARSAGEKERDDVITFKGSNFTSAYLEKKGFKPVQYDEDSRGIQTGTFNANLKSDAEGTAKWTGTMAAGELKGELAWTKPDGTILHFTFTGSKTK